MKDKSKLVSVIIPAYNVAEYIEKCLESVCMQTYEKLQIIVVDDNSTDETYDKAKAFLLSDGRITIIRKENEGVSVARNLGLKHSVGDYIFFVDGDDTVESNAIEVLVEALENENADFVTSCYSKWDKFGNRLQDVDFSVGEYDFKSDYERFAFLLKELVPYKVGVEAWGKLFRNSIIKEQRIMFPAKCHIGEDFAFTAKYILHSERITCIPDRTYRYNVRNDSAMNNQGGFNSRLSQRIYMLKDVWQHIEFLGNESYIELFPVFFMMAVNNIYIGHSASEVSGELKFQDEAGFVKKIYQKLPEVREQYFNLDNCEISRIKFMYHMYIRAVLNGFSYEDLIKLSLYNAYRSIRGMDRLECWIMPY